MRIHFIAIGGSIMHALAIDTMKKGHQVSGSDDEIYEPSRSQLEKYDLLPFRMGWDDMQITSEIDLVVLGMHAKADNPELLKAQRLGIRIVSFPAFIAEMSANKTRVVVAGSHGKTTTTSMIMHVLRQLNMQFDYLVGARLEGFENMVSLSEAPIIIIEGDEYLSSAIDKRPKFFHFQPDITVITGIEWDHMNVFPTDENYTDQFRTYVTSLPEKSFLFYYRHDQKLLRIVNECVKKDNHIPYDAHPYDQGENNVALIKGAKKVDIKIFGRHNMENLQAAKLVCLQLGVSESDFLTAIRTFTGAHKRLQLLFDDENNVAYQDFAHAPSKVRATTQAVRERHPGHHVIACVELHTYSSLNALFLPNYLDTLSAADEGLVYYNAHTFEIKKLPILDKTVVREGFGGDVEIFTDVEELKKALKGLVRPQTVLLFMSSGTFDHMDLGQFCKSIFNE